MVQWLPSIDQSIGEDVPLCDESVAVLGRYSCGCRAYHALQGLAAVGAATAADATNGYSSRK